MGKKLTSNEINELSKNSNFYWKNVSHYNN